MDLCEPHYISGAQLTHRHSQDGRSKRQAGVIGGILKLSPLAPRDKIYSWQLSDSPLLLGYTHMSPLHPPRSGWVCDVYIQPYSQSRGH